MIAALGFVVLVGVLAGAFGVAAWAAGQIISGAGDAVADPAAEDVPPTTGNQLNDTVLEALLGGPRIPLQRDTNGEDFEGGGPR